jgi:hypothetical protein
MAVGNVGGNIIISQLTWTDDSFRTYNWSPTTAYSSSGDEIYILANQTITRNLINTFNSNQVGAIDFRYYTPTPSTTVAFSLVSSGTTVYSASFTVNNTTYSFSSINVSLGSNTINQINIITGGNPVVLDFVALEYSPSTYIQESGSQMVIQMTKKTIQLQIPNTFDYIEQLGISSRNIQLTLNKALRSSYNQIEYWVQNNIPVIYLTPTLQATGFISNVQGVIGGAYVPIVYDITATLIKGNMEIP